MNDSLHQHMSAMNEQEASDGRECPMTAMEKDPSLLAEETELVFIQHRRGFGNYWSSSSVKRS